MPSTIPEFEASWNSSLWPPVMVNGMVTMAFLGCHFPENIDVNEVKPHEELFVFVRCQVIRSILKDVMFFVHLDISGSYPRHEVGLFSRVRMPWRMEKDAFFFDVHVVLFEAIQKLQDPWWSMDWFFQGEFAV